MKKTGILIICFVIYVSLTTPPVHAESLSNFMKSCAHNEALRDKGLGDPGDTAAAFYCRGFISGLYAGLYSDQKLTEGTCSGRYIDIERLLTFVTVYYKEEQAGQKGSELALFESQPPEWFVAKALGKACPSK